MNEARESIVRQLAETYSGDTVYLPPRRQDGHTCNTAAEHHAANPAVVAANEQYFESPDRLHGAGVPSQTIVREKPIHRMMVLLSAKGLSNKEIAEHVDMTPTQVSLVLRQPWAQARLVQILKETSMDEIRHFHKTEVVPSLHVLREIRDSAPKHSDRLAASKEILDRALGKATIHVEAKNTNTNLPADMARLDAEIASLRKQVGDTMPSAN